MRFLVTGATGKVGNGVARQLVELDGGGIDFSLPKNGKVRTVSVPDVTPTGFPLRRWLLQRIHEVEAEQRNGRNPDGILFPSPRGMTYWRLRNLRNRVFVPAAALAGWKSRLVDGWVTYRKGGKVIRARRTMRVWDHPIHSLRHRFATTAAEDWKFSDTELCALGGWSSADFVRKTYIGVSRQALDSASAKQDKAQRKARRRSKKKRKKKARKQEA